MYLRSAVLAVVAAVLLLMCGLDLGRGARGIVVLPLRLWEGGRECGFVVAEMLSLRGIARVNGGASWVGWSETRLGWLFFLRLVSQRAATQRWRKLRVVERYALGKTCLSFTNALYLFEVKMSI